MKLVPIHYPLRSVVVRWRSSLFSAAGIACTVAVIAGILSLREGFSRLYANAGSDDVLVYLRPGALSEGQSSIRNEQVRLLKYERKEIERDGDGRPLAAGETFSALFLDRVDGGTTNVPVRGIEEMSVAIHGDAFRIEEGRGRMLTFGADEIIVGTPVSERIANCGLGDTLVINVTPFRVVGVFEYDGAYASEIWGDADRIGRALDQTNRQRVIARRAEGTDITAVAAELESDKRVPAEVQTEREYLDSQRLLLGATFDTLATIIGSIMGVAAILGATTTMLASIGSRTREVGIFASLGFPRFSIFVAFLLEALIVGLAGGVLGCLAVLPFNGVETGTTNFQTFTEVSFAAHIGPPLLVKALVVAVMLGVIGGVVPAWRAARLLPTEALRRH